MNFNGADTDQLLAYAEVCRRSSEQTLESMEYVQGRINSVEWYGQDAEQFRETFGRVRNAWSTAGDSFYGMAEKLAMQAAQQDAASAPDGRVDVSRYGDLLGGDFPDWSDVINFGERLGDLWRDPVRAGSDSNVLGKRYVDKYPNWDPSSIDTSKEAIEKEVMQQGAVGDCWYLAALMAVQQTDPQLLADNITAKGNPPGSEGWVVTLYIDGEPKEVSVAPSDIGVRGARDAQKGAGGPGVLSIYEQAMINEADGRASKVSADTPAAGIEIITGKPAAELTLGGQPSFEEYKKAIDEGRPVTVMTDPLMTLGPARDELITAHVYHVSGYDAETRELILTNPHGPDADAAYQVRVKPDDWRYENDIVMTGIGEK